MNYHIEKLRRWIKWRIAEWQFHKVAYRMILHSNSTDDFDPEFDEKLYEATQRQYQYLKLTQDFKVESNSASPIYETQFTEETGGKSDAENAQKIQ